MIVPYEEALQELWVSHRADQHQREHRPNPDYSLFIAEFKTAMERIKADAIVNYLREWADELGPHSLYSKWDIHSMIRNRIKELRKEEEA